MEEDGEEEEEEEEEEGRRSGGGGRGFGGEAGLEGVAVYARQGGRQRRAEQSGS